MIAQLSDINIKSNLETFFTLWSVILLLGLTSISLGKSVFSGHYSFTNGKFYEVVVTFNILPRSTATAVVRFLAGSSQSNRPSDCSIWICSQSATQLFKNKDWCCFYTILLLLSCSAVVLLCISTLTLSSRALTPPSNPQSLTSLQGDDELLFAQKWKKADPSRLVHEKIQEDCFKILKFD